MEELVSCGVYTLRDVVACVASRRVSAYHPEASAPAPFGQWSCASGSACWCGAAHAAWRHRRANAAAAREVLYTIERRGGACAPWALPGRRRSGWCAPFRALGDPRRGFTCTTLPRCPRRGIYDYVTYSWDVVDPVDWPKSGVADDWLPWPSLPGEVLDDVLTPDRPRAPFEWAQRGGDPEPLGSLLWSGVV